MKQGRGVYINAEPCVVDVDCVVALLTRVGWDVAAGMIQQMARRDRAANAEADRWRRLYESLRDKYEPVREQQARVSYRPGPECDG